MNNKVSELLLTGFVLVLFIGLVVGGIRGSMESKTGDIMTEIDGTNDNTATSTAGN